MAFKPYRDESRSNWGCTDRQPDTNELKLSALMRIADATEIMAREYNRLISDRDMDREMAAHANRELAALKARIAEAPIGIVNVDDRGCEYVSVDFAENTRVRLLVDEPAPPMEPGSLDELRIERGGGNHG